MDNERRYVRARGFFEQTGIRMSLISETSSFRDRIRGNVFGESELHGRNLTFAKRINPPDINQLTPPSGRIQPLCTPPMSPLGGRDLFVTDDQQFQATGNASAGRQTAVRTPSRHDPHVSPFPGAKELDL